MANEKTNHLTNRREAGDIEHLRLVAPESATRRRHNPGAHSKEQNHDEDCGLPPLCGVSCRPAAPECGCGTPPDAGLTDRRARDSFP